MTHEEHEAEVDALKDRIKALERALDPFAAAYGKTPFSQDGPLACDYAKTWELSTADFRRARAVLDEKPEAE